MKAGIFVRPQIKILEGKEFLKKPNEMAESVWNNFVAVLQGFLRNNKAINYVELVEILVKNNGKMGCRMSVKVHIFDTHLDKFKYIWVYLEEQGE